MSTLILAINQINIELLRIMLEVMGAVSLDF